MKASQLTDVVTAHGEGPVYCARWAGPRWVDMIAGDIMELADDGSVHRFHVGSVAAVIRPRSRGGHVVVGERGLLLADGDALDSPLRALPEVWTDESVRMNEGGCDPAGELYVGSMSYDAHEGGGRLYRFSPDGQPSVVLEAVTISNGLDWSPDGSLAYYNDTAVGRTDVFDWSPLAGLTNRRPFVTPAGSGGPDGLTVDAEGGVWVAFYGGSAVRRYDPDGRLDAVIELPVSQVTAVTFAGPDLDRLVITTSREGMGESAESLAGALFTAEPGIRGRSVLSYAG
ncbi:MAG TPA: SMP-30/gluconolactonase/LRE family protein [Propionibacteriaceae bacterium]|nr:SMP-30/gluconolactonase/LRE family protein [Propionibacteriaceae bacterium]